MVADRPKRRPSWGADALASTEPPGPGAAGGPQSVLYTDALQSTPQDLVRLAGRVLLRPRAVAGGGAGQDLRLPRVRRVHPDPRTHRRRHRDREQVAPLGRG